MSEVDLYIEFFPEEHNNGLVYYDLENDRIYILTKKCKVYFKDNSFWRLFKDYGFKTMKIKSFIECKKIMEYSGYEYIGEL